MFNVVFHDLLKKLGMICFSVASKYRIIIQLSDRLREVKYNTISQLGSLKGDQVHLVWGANSRDLRERNSK